MIKKKIKVIVSRNHSMYDDPDYVITIDGIYATQYGPDKYDLVQAFIDGLAIIFGREYLYIEEHDVF